MPQNRIAAMHTESTTTVATTRKNLLLFLGFITRLGVVSGIGVKKRHENTTVKCISQVNNSLKIGF
jgi:hypothetical protein